MQGVGREPRADNACVACSRCPTMATRCGNAGRSRPRCCVQPGRQARPGRRRRLWANFRPPGRLARLGRCPGRPLGHAWTPPRLQAPKGRSGRARGIAGRATAACVSLTTPSVAARGRARAGGGVVPGADRHGAGRERRTAIPRPGGLGAAPAAARGDGWPAGRNIGRFTAVNLRGACARRPRLPVFQSGIRIAQPVRA